jgi:hypothetical protein
MCVNIAVLCAALAGCNSSNEDNEHSDSDALLSQTQTALAQRKPEFRNGAVFSGALGYSAELPADWIILPTVAISDGDQDTFSAPAGEGLPSTIQVRCFRAADEEASIQSAIDQTRRAFHNVIDGPSRVVDGHDTVSLRYMAGTPPLEVEREDVRFAAGGCAWSISYITPPGEREIHLDSFDRFLGSFHANP